MPGEPVRNGFPSSSCYRMGSAGILERCRLESFLGVQVGLLSSFFFFFF